MQPCRPVAFAAVHVVERRRCHPTVDHVARLCNGWDAIVVEITDHGELDLPVTDVARTSWERHCAEHVPMRVEQLASLSLARDGLPDVRLARAAWQAHCLCDDLAELLVAVVVLPRRDAAQRTTPATHVFCSATPCASHRESDRAEGAHGISCQAQPICVLHAQV